MEACDSATPLNSLSERGEDQLRPLLADVFLDPTGVTEPAAIAAQAFESGHCTLIFQAPLPDQALWLRFTVVNDHGSEKQWFVAFMEFIFDEVILFEQQPDGLINLSRNGRTVPLPERVNTEVKTGFPLTVGPGEEKTFYLRIQGTFAPTITPVIMSSYLFTGWSTLTLVMTALFLGYVGAIAIISLVLFQHIEARFYQYYALYMLCLFVFSFIYDGWLSNFVGVTLPVTVMSPIREFMAGLGVFANIQYCRVLLRIDAGTPGLRRLFLVLSGIAVVTTGLAVVDPWGLSLPLHLAFFACPLVLLGVAFKRIYDGLPQAKFVFGSLLALTSGLSIAVYSFVFPIEITQAAVAYDLIVMRPLTWGYYLAVMGETTFMMLAISTMVNALHKQRHTAVVEVQALRRDAIAAQDQHAESLKTASARIEALEASLIESPQKSLQSPAEQRFVESATRCVLEHLGEQGFGARELAAALGTSEKTLGRRLKEACGLAPAAFIRSVRLTFARDLILLRQRNTIAEIAHAAGFSNVGHFAKLYRREFGQTPSESFRSTKTVD
ncbi:helix-turn-helix domain-containing protein [Pelagibius litoralis]|uniref:Helix-turn-helix domain-containing protein n=1 Tax=Pelagibius litoralis TaxID=374515 RepID=A0A967KFY4_9PROT|nr:helix-turn-helix domain-containing protein [Pelagibius litoralis]NIA69916.1 helix-turn-helix domain-containing protein [Pelagibius litoralis]